MTMYLLHLSRPYRHAKHYCGFVGTPAALPARLERHRKGTGARLMEVVAAAGIGFELARVWPDRDRAGERRIKNQGGLSRCCPICRASKRRAR